MILPAGQLSVYFAAPLNKLFKVNCDTQEVEETSIYEKKTVMKDKKNSFSLLAAYICKEGILVCNWVYRLGLD